MWSLLMLGCADFLALSDAFADLTAPLVVQATYIGVEEPPAEMSLEGTSWADGSRVQALLADASAFGDLDAAPVDDASVALELDGQGVGLQWDSDGNFSASAADGLGWAEGVDASLVIDRDGEKVLSLITPPSPDARIAAEHALHQPMEVELSGQPFDNVMVTVLRLNDGETVYDSLPTDIDGLYELTHSKGDLITEVPGETFAQSGVYAIGVMGLVNADPDTYQGVNLVLSALTAGAMQFSVVTVR